MALPAEKLVVSPVVVGRERYLESFASLVDGLDDGHGQFIAIEGEAGLGKSRLVAEARRIIAGRAERGMPVQVMQGHCFEPDASLPYAPFLDLLRGCFATHPADEIRDCLGPEAPVLARLLPEISAIVPGITVDPPGEPDQEKRRIFHALWQFFARQAASAPLMIVIEDMHWSDDTSLELLGRLGRRLATSPILLTITFRSDEMQPALRQALAALDRDHLLLEWPLSRLTSRDVEHMIQAIFDLDTSVRPEFLDAIYSLTEGNPFFIEEVLKSLIASGDIFYADGAWDRKPIDEIEIPRSIHAAVSVRTAHLSDEAQRTLVIAAVAGRRFDFDLLQLMTSKDERELLDVIKELMAAQLVVEASAEHFAFRHALSQQAIYTDLLARERRGLHRDIAAALRQLAKNSIDARLPELARHFYAAEEWDEAYYYCRRFAESAQTLNAPAAAIEQFSRAIEAAGHLGIAVPASMHRARGQAYEAHGDFDAARADYETTFDMAVAAADARAQWQALIDQGFLWAGRDYARARDYFQRAADVASDLGDPLIEAQSFNRLANWLVNTGETQQGIELHQRALAAFREHNDERGVGETLDLLGMAYGMHDDNPSSAAAYHEAVNLLRPFGESLVLCSTLTSRATWASPSMSETGYSAFGTFEACARDSAEAIDMARRLDSRVALAFAEWTGGSVYGTFGRFSEGIAHAMEGLRVATEAQHPQWTAGAQFTLGQMYALMCMPDAAIEVLDAGVALAHTIGSAWWLGNCSSYLAFAHMQRRDLPQAEAVLAAAWPAAHLPRNFTERRVSWAWGRLALENGDFEGAIATADRLAESAPKSGSPQVIPEIARLKGEALAAMRRYDEAAEVLTPARDAAIQRGSPVFLWPVHRALGRALQSLRRSDEAEGEFAAARNVIAALAASIDDTVQREQFERTALDSLPRLKPIPASRAAKEAFGGLTTREREVAALVALGKSNRDIADDLVLGERTIETHVGNVLSKLGFSSRAQIAAWAVEKGLRPH